MGEGLLVEYRPEGARRRTERRESGVCSVELFRASRLPPAGPLVSTLWVALIGLEVPARSTRFADGLATDPPLASTCRNRAQWEG